MVLHLYQVGVFDAYPPALAMESHGAVGWVNIALRKLAGGPAFFGWPYCIDKLFELDHIAAVLLRDRRSNPLGRLFGAVSLARDNRIK
jgi:hypothetical protein